MAHSSAAAAPRRRALGPAPSLTGAAPSPAGAAPARTGAASSSTGRAPSPTGAALSSTGPASDVHPVLRRATAPPAALGLLAQAHAGLAEAATLEAPNERYATAHLAALRTAAAVLAARGRPETSPRRRARIRSAWEVLPEIAPELTEWSALFASGAARRARAEAGIRGAASRRDADDLIRDVAMFLRLVERMLVLQPVLPRPRRDAGDPGGAGARGDLPDAV
ncbi:SAV_6107 family HEPN domain-containing protein [Streptomyces sp. KHY 26]|uniref:SAV_6107 family HEPN domain-containing protein n=1 Tax=Streptomyces sp. KHY 26 TaxID=3097359 RepID=UPI00376EED9D